MKILNLLEIINTDVSTKKYSGMFDIYRAGQRHPKVIDSGAFSIVRTDDNDPHMVVKRSRRPMTDETDDGYILYAKAIVEQKLYENPHFPRIYVSKRIVDRGGQFINKYTMEKLTPNTDMYEEDFRAVAETFFNFEDNTVNNLVSIIVEAIDDAILGMHLDKIKSDVLLEACQTVGELYKKFGKNTNIVLDVGINNIMYRRGPTGFIPVITDPIA